MTPRVGPLLSRIFKVVPCAFGEFNGVFRFQFFFFHVEESRDTQPNCVDSFSGATDLFAPPFFDFLLGISSASTCRRNMFLHMCILSQTCSFYTRGCQNLHDGYLGISLLLSEELSSLLPCVFLRIFLSLRQSWPSSLAREKTVVLFVSDHCVSLL